MVASLLTFHTHPEVAKMLGVSVSTVFRLGERVGAVRTRSPGAVEEALYGAGVQAKMVKLKEELGTWKRVADHLGVHYQVVKRWVHMHGLSKKSLIGVRRGDWVRKMS